MSDVPLSIEGSLPSNVPIAVLPVLGQLALNVIKSLFPQPQPVQEVSPIFPAPQPQPIPSLTIPIIPQPIGPIARLPIPQPQPSDITPIGTRTDIVDLREFKPSQTEDQTSREFKPSQNFPQGQTQLELQHKPNVIRNPGELPHLTGEDPPQLPDLDAIKAAAIAANPDSTGTTPCLSCQMTDEERAQLLDAMPPDAVEVSFTCPSADEAEKLSKGEPHGCIPN